MTGSGVNVGPHISDGDLIRLIDGECSPDEQAELHAHIDSCANCRQNADSLEHASLQFTSALTELDNPAPSRPRRVPEVGGRLPRSRSAIRFFSPRVLRAAAVLALMTLIVTATPARAWIVRGWYALKAAVVHEQAEQPVESVAPPHATAPEISSLLRFTPRGSEFQLEFMERPLEGTLLISFDSSTTASAGAIGDDTSDEMILLPRGLRVRNSSTSTTSYEITLPLTLSFVEIRIGGRTELRLDVASHSGPFRRQLSLASDSGR